jgi:hypothetical protein
VVEEIMQIGLDRLAAALSSEDVKECRSQVSTDELDRMTASFTSAGLAQEIQEGAPGCIC